MQPSEIGYHIMREIALSPKPVTAYSLKDNLKKDYKTIHKTCKKLIDDGFLEETNGINIKNAQKNILKFSLYGFCFFVTKCGWFFGRELPLIDYDYSSQRTLLKNWQHLHETIAYYFTLFLKIQEIEKELGNIEVQDRGIAALFSHRLYFACNNVVIFNEADNEFILKTESKWTMRELIKAHNPNWQLYIEMFDQLTEFVSSPGIIDVQLYSIDDVLKFFRVSKGNEFIKCHLERTNIRIQTKLYCIKNF
jgi:hypothetical protein